LAADFRDDWILKTDFETCDAAKYVEKYCDADGKDFTHIYSYNKVMSVNDRKGICQILNRTNFRIMAWYFDPNNTRKTGLKHFELLYKASMLSTGNEKFTCYVYYKTKLYNPDEKDLWLDSDTSDAEDDEESKSEHAFGSKRPNNEDIVKLE
jgi:hypothetical protein